MAAHSRPMPPPDVNPPPMTVTQEVDDADTAERERQVHVEAERAHASSRARGNAYHRSAAAKSTNEEIKQRWHQREAVTAAQRPGAATAHLTFGRQVGPLARLEGEEAAEVMRTKPTRLPDLVLQGPHEAAPSFHEDWTIVPGSSTDPELWERRAMPAPSTLSRL